MKYLRFRVDANSNGGFLRVSSEANFNPLIIPAILQQYFQKYQINFQLKFVDGVSVGLWDD